MYAFTHHAASLSTCLFCWEWQVGGRAAMKAFLVPSPQPTALYNQFILDELQHISKRVTSKRMTSHLLFSVETEVKADRPSCFTWFRSLLGNLPNCLSWRNYKQKQNLACHRAMWPRTSMTVTVCTGSVKTQTHSLKYEAETETRGGNTKWMYWSGCSMWMFLFLLSTTFTESVWRVAHEVRFLHVARATAALLESYWLSWNSCAKTWSLQCLTHWWVCTSAVW